MVTNVATNEVAEFLQRQGYQTTTVEPLEETTAGFGSSLLLADRSNNGNHNNISYRILCSMRREFRTKELPLLNRIFFSWIFFVNG